MSKYHDDRAAAVNPGRLTLSEAKLRDLQPALFDPGTSRCNPLCPVDHPRHELREMYAEHMHLGASEPAMVVSRVPLIVAAHAGDLDAAVLLRFPASFVPRYGLGVGTRLLVVNTYQEVRGTQNADPWYAVDLIPGPDRHQWQNAFPLVAEFLSDDAERIERRKREIPEEEWRRLDENARRRIQRWGIETARDARPTLAKTPHRLGGDEYFQPIEAFERGPVRRPRALARALEVVVTLVIAAIALALLHWAWTVQGGL